jgi:putative transcriptional regulator
MGSVDTLRGQLLIASPSLLDPNFRRTVVLVGEHSEEGAMGVVLNRPSPVSVEEAVPLLAPFVADADRVHVGGPVQQQAIIVLGEFASPEKAGSLVLGAIGFLPASVEEGESLGELPRARVFAGYAGWAPGQLEEEIDEDAWIVTTAEPDDVFTDDQDGLWARVLRRMGGRYTLLARMPVDPGVN